MVARLPLPIGGGGALCALNRCRAERGNEDEEPSLARAQATPATKDAWRGVAVPRGAQAPPNDATPQHRPHDVAITNLELERTASSSCREGGRTTTRRYDDEQFVAEFHRVRGTLSKSMPVNTGGLPHRDVAAATCDGAALERGRGREAGVLMVARQGVARVVRMDTLAYVWAVPATRTKANRERTGSPHGVS